MMQPRGCLKWKSTVGECLQQLRNIGNGGDCLRNYSAHPDFRPRAGSLDRLKSGETARVNRHLKVCHHVSWELSCDAFDCGWLTAFDLNAFDGKSRIDVLGQDCPIGIFCGDYAKRKVAERIGQRSSEIHRGDRDSG